MTSSLNIDPRRLRQDLEELARIGAGPEGGVTRLAFSPAEKAARQWMEEKMEAAGLAIRTDPAASLFGRLRGRDPRAPVLLLGSHLDTVPGGGRFDGALGCVGALEVARTLMEADISLTHPLEVAVWSDEEGARFGPGVFGSRAFTTGIDAAELEIVDQDGVDLASALREFGGDPDRLDEARRDPGKVACFLELHPEQGPILEREGTSLGVVEGIVGISRWQVTVEGAVNHAGTTPMEERRDALVAAARLAERVRREIRRSEGEPVGNVGWIQAEPGVTNVVAGRATLPVELRALDQEVVEALWTRIEDGAREIAEEEEVQITARPTGREPPGLSDPSVSRVLEEAAREMGASCRRIGSGGGHDAQVLARAGIPMGMVFVPSQGGISHSPREFTAWEDCARGAEVLFRAVRMLDRWP